MNHPHYHLDSVTVRYGALEALKQISISIQRGERIALIGPSGSGKSTFLGLLNGSVRPSSGEVYVDGVALSSFSAKQLREHRRSVGFVYQDHNLVPTLRVIQNVLSAKLGEGSFLTACKLLFFAGAKEQEEVFELLKRLGVGEKLFEYVSTLSGGERQRVAIARALFQTPHTLLADEPVASVDPIRARETLSIFSDIARNDGLTLCMSLHNVELAKGLLDRVVGIRSGVLQLDSPQSEIAAEDLSVLYALDSRSM